MITIRKIINERIFIMQSRFCIGISRRQQSQHFILFFGIFFFFHNVLSIAYFNLFEKRMKKIFEGIIDLQSNIKPNKRRCLHYGKLDLSCGRMQIQPRKSMLCQRNYRFHQYSLNESGKSQRYCL